MKREFVLRLVCQKQGCHEVGRFAYSDKKDYAEGYKRHNGKWFCSRHSDENRVLMPNNLRTTMRKELTCVALEHIGGEHFWDGKNGFASGDCFRAWAKDFPVGTKLVVESVAHIILPPEEIHQPLSQ